MQREPTSASPERDETDESLRVERTKTDDALAEREAAIQASSDAVVAHARRRSEAVLDDARARADLAIEGDGESPAHRRALDQERAVEDASIRAEQTIADDELDVERRERTQMLADLLRYERGHTDERLRAERVHGDDALRSREGRAEDAERRARFLGEASRLLGTSLDYERTLNRVARLALPAIADFCIVDLVDDQRRITRVALAHVDPANEALLDELQRRRPLTWESPEPAARVLRTGQPELTGESPGDVVAAHGVHADHADLAARSDVRSHLVVPLIARERVIGALSLGLTRPDRRYGAEDLALAVELAERASHAVDNAHLYEETRRALRLRDEFLTAASHELKTPVTTIQLHVEGLERGEHGVRDRDKLDAMKRQVRRLEALIHTLLDVSGPVDDATLVHREPVDLARLLAEVAARFAAAVERTRTPIRVDAPPALVGVWDRERLEQIVTELVGNAMKFGVGRPVDVVATSDGTAALLRVVDAGVGIAPADQQRIFERYERAASLDHFSGFGLGLWNVRRSVEAMGGTIAVHSEVGRGATFIVRLPLRADGARRVDDDEDARR